MHRLLPASPWELCTARKYTGTIFCFELALSRRQVDFAAYVAVRRRQSFRKFKVIVRRGLSGIAPNLRVFKYISEIYRIGGREPVLRNDLDRQRVARGKLLRAYFRRRRARRFFPSCLCPPRLVLMRVSVRDPDIM